MNKTRVYISLEKLNPLDRKKVVDLYKEVSTNKVNPNPDQYIFYDTSTRQLKMGARSQVRVKTLTEIDAKKFNELFTNRFTVKTQQTNIKTTRPYIGMIVSIEDLLETAKNPKLYLNRYTKGTQLYVQTVLSIGSPLVKIKPINSLEENNHDTFILEQEAERIYEKHKTNKTLKFFKMENETIGLETKTIYNLLVQMEGGIDALKGVSDFTPKDGTKQMYPRSAMFGLTINTPDGQTRYISKFDNLRKMFGTYANPKNTSTGGKYYPVIETFKMLTRESISYLNLIIEPFPYIGSFVKLDTIERCYGGSEHVKKYAGLVGVFSDYDYYEYRSMNMGTVKYSDDFEITIPITKLIKSIDKDATAPSTIHPSYYRTKIDKEETKTTVVQSNDEVVEEVKVKPQPKFQVSVQSFKANALVSWNGIKCKVKSTNGEKLLLLIESTEETISALPSNVIRLASVGDLVSVKTQDGLLFKYLSEEDSTDDIELVVDEVLRNTIEALLP